MTEPLGGRSSELAAGGIADLLAGYRPEPELYDEMMDGAGSLRPHWRPLLQRLAALGADEIGNRALLTEQHLSSSGVFYRVYNVPDQAERPWRLGPIPLVIPESEWAAVVRGLQQRADLIELVLADVYGPQRLVSEGLLPAAAIAGSPEFLRPLHGVKPRSGRHMMLYAADIGRDPAGRWWVLRDRTQAPSGSGYALENRIAITSSLGDIYQSFDVHRLASYFGALRTALNRYLEDGDSGICLMSPGPLNETYFEHVYLARYLGFRLVEGQDLSVRGDRVYLRTIYGLRPVNVVVRRLDADFADPLELNTQSRLGVPGLVETIRNGRLAIANALGSGLAESAVLLGFLPALAKRLLGEALAMPNVATWWCGQANERDIVLSGLERMLVAPAFSSAAAGRPVEASVRGADLSAEERRALADEIRLRGADFVGQEPVKLSTMPVWDGGRLVPRPFVLRVYLAAVDDGWQALPGGLCIIGERSDQTAMTMQQGARSADVWVLAENPVHSVSMLPAAGHEPIRRAVGALPSRAAENLYWLARYTERAEATARVARTILSRYAERHVAQKADVAALVDLLVKWGAAPPGTSDPLAAAMLALVDSAGSGTAATLMVRARAAAFVIRDRYPLDAWTALDGATAKLARAQNAQAGQPPGLVIANDLLRDIAAITGHEHENMNRLAGWHFLMLGACLERAITTSRSVRQLAHQQAPAESLDALLATSDNQSTYRVRYLHEPTRKTTLDLVILDETNPRALAFSLADIVRHLAALTDSGRDADAAGLGASAQAMLDEVRAMDPGSIPAPSLVGLENRLMQLSDRITGLYFNDRRTIIAVTPLPAIEREGDGAR